MSATNQTLNSKGDTSTLVRPKFGPGMLLQHDDLEQLAQYTRDLSRLLFRSFFGCGVVCGLRVTVDKKCEQACVTVEKGLALDGCGDPIYVPRDVSVLIDKNCDPNLTGTLWVVLCRTSKCCAPRAPMCASDDEAGTSVSTRERDGYEIRIVRGDDPPKCACVCDKPLMDTKEESNCKCIVNPEGSCYADHYEGKCGGCSCGDCGDGSCECECSCVVLARLTKEKGDGKVDTNLEPHWVVYHRFRRFIRPILMRDPLIAKDPKQAVSSTAGDGTKTVKVQQMKEKTDKAKQEMVDLAEALTKAERNYALSSEALGDAVAAARLDLVPKEAASVEERVEGAPAPPHANAPPFAAPAPAADAEEEPAPERPTKPKQHKK